ncbi:MAG: hypothetical protein AB1627_01120 [Chloroflexota bacterium]
MQEDVKMVTNEQIRRARPSVDSPLGRLIKGEITRSQYEQQVAEKSARERDVTPTQQPERHAASGR